MSAKGLRTQQVKAWDSVLTAIVESTMTWVVAMASPLLRITIGTPAGIEGVTHVRVKAEMLMHWDRGAWPAALLHLVD